jgi:hypothetical protein
MMARAAAVGGRGCDGNAGWRRRCWWWVTPWPCAARARRTPLIARLFCSAHGGRWHVSFGADISVDILVPDHWIAYFTRERRKK